MRSAHIAAVLAGLLIATTLPGCSAPKAPRSPDYEKGYRLGLEAYTYGLPLLETNKTFLTQTSVNVPNGDGFGPVNQFSSVRKLNNPKSKTVVAPGSNGLSSIAWLDLAKEPQVIHVPQTDGHFFALGLLDPYTENFATLSSAYDTKPGDYVIAGPGQHTVPIPAGTSRINADYDRIWVIGSTQLKGPKDVTTVNRIQDGYTVTPLSAYGTEYNPPTPAKRDTTVKNYQLPTGLEFFDQLGEQLALFPPPTADEPQLRKLAEVGIGPGMTPSKSTTLSPDTLKGLSDAVQAGPGQIKKNIEVLFLKDFRKHDGYLLGGFGNYGTDYKLRAVIAQIGLGALSSRQTIFAISPTDRKAKPLEGSTDYVLHLPSAPPGLEGWSLTAYDLQGALIPNAINRYEISNHTKLAKNADGSMDIYLQATRPSDPAKARNWLPTASDQGFEVIWRVLGPEPNQISGILDGSGWQPPAITVEASGTAGGK